MTKKTMKSVVSCEKTLRYFADSARLPYAELPVRVLSRWDIIQPMAYLEKVYGYLVPWVLENWHAHLDPSMRELLINKIFMNKWRNQKIMPQIRSLSDLFNSHDIPAMFLKGAAGLLQDIYATESRSMADIDILVEKGRMSRAIDILISAGYIQDNTVHVPPYHHHVSPFMHPGHPVAVELHYEPYDYSMLDRPVMPHIWENAVTIDRDGVRARVPNATDHAWITMRSHGYNKVTVTRFHEAVELICLQRSGLEIDFDKLLRQCTSDLIPGMINSVFYTMKHYFDVEAPVPYTPADSWISWSERLNRRLYWEPEHRNVPAKRFGCLAFLCGPTFDEKKRLFGKLVRYETQWDAARMHVGEHHTSWLRPYRYGKNLVLAIPELLKYALHAFNIFR